MSKRAASVEWRTIRFFWRTGWRHRSNLYVVMSLVPISTLLLSTAMPYYIGKILASLGTNVHQATHYLPFLLVIVLLGAIANRYGFMFLLKWQAKTWADLQTATLDALLQQSASFHNDRVAGKLVSDAIEFPTAFGQISNAFFVNIIPFGLTIISGVLLVSLHSWQLGLILTGMAIAAVGSAAWQSKRRRPMRRERLKANKAVTAHLGDAIVNNQTIKTFAREQFEMRRHGKLNDNFRARRLHDWMISSRDANNRVSGLLLFEVLFVLITIHLVTKSPALLAIGIFAFSYSINVMNNLFTINNIIRSIEDALLQAMPMMEVLGRTPDILDQPDANQLKVKKGEIIFKDVDFGYEEQSGGDAVFRRLNLHIAPGEKVGLVGPSGGGKSTLTRLLLRFNDIQGGSITIDGQNIAAVTQSSLRENIAYVPQEPLMFHRSVIENIAYGRPQSTLAEVTKAAKHAHAHEFIADLPNGYDTLVGERGVKLSGGQRQRVAIARAILKHAPILLLDEATSALDSESEALIQEALWELMQSKTAVVVAHRLSTIQRMDRIVVLDKGQIMEQGTHRQLLAHKGLYAKLWKHQSGGFIEE